MSFKILGSRQAISIANTHATKELEVLGFGKIPAASSKAISVAAEMLPLIISEVKGSPYLTVSFEADDNDSSGPKVVSFNAGVVIGATAAADVVFGGGVLVDRTAANNQVDLSFPLPSGAMLLSFGSDAVTKFTGGAVSAASLTVGFTAGGVELRAATNVFAGAGALVGPATAPAMRPIVGGGESVVARVALAGANQTALTAGQLSIKGCYLQFPDLS